MNRTERSSLRPVFSSDNVQVHTFSRQRLVFGGTCCREDSHSQVFHRDSSENVKIVHFIPNYFGFHVLKCNSRDYQKNKRNKWDQFVIPKLTAYLEQSILECDEYKALAKNDCVDSSPDCEQLTNFCSLASEPSANFEARVKPGDFPHMAGKVEQTIEDVIKV